MAPDLPHKFFVPFSFRATSSDGRPTFRRVRLDIVLPVLSRFRRVWVDGFHRLAGQLRQGGALELSVHDRVHRGCTNPVLRLGNRPRLGCSAWSAIAAAIGVWMEVAQLPRKTRFCVPLTHDLSPHRGP